MGNVKKTAAKGQKQRSQFRPKRSDGADKSKFKKKAKKAKKEKDSIKNRIRIERKAEKNDENLHIENIGMKVKKKKTMMMKEVEAVTGNGAVVEKPSAAQQLRYFLHLYQSGNGIQLSALELEAFKDECMLEVCQGTDQNICNLGEYIKLAFGSLWKEVLWEKQLTEGEIDPGNPAVLVISLSALRSLELLRELRPLTKECHAVKLFSKHMKIEEQVSFLKNRVNIACGTPNRIKKLIDIEALGLSRLTVLVLDMYTDVKGYSLFTLPQVREEFWDLYKSYFHDRLLGSNLRICLYGKIPELHMARPEAADN